MTGIITDLDECRFTQGDCHYLARALHKARPELRLAAFYADCGPELHAFLLTPRGRVLDIYGVQTQAATKRRWKTSMPIREFTWQDLRQFGRPEYGIYTYRRAHVVAATLLAGYDA